MTEEIRAVQNAMAKETSAFFDEDEAEALRTLVRISLEVSDWLAAPPEARKPPRDFQYQLDTVISGIESFQTLTFGYRILSGAQVSQLDWAQLTAAEVSAAIARAREQFLIEKDVLSRCRSLLDLYKLQLFLVAVFYS